MRRLGPGNGIFNLKSCSFTAVRAFMIDLLIRAIIHYQHSPDEVAELRQAIEPLLEYVHERKLLRILEGEYFAARDARQLRDTLLSAANRARSHLGDYFPMVQQSVIAQAEQLENAARAYYERFRQLQDSTIPIH